MASLQRTERGRSPTRVLYENRKEMQEKIHAMAISGLHVFNPTWNQMGWRVEKGDVVRAVTLHSHSFREITLTIFGTDEKMSFPVQVCTNVRDVKGAVSLATLAEPEALTFLERQGSHWRVVADHEEIPRKTIVKGIRSFKPAPHRWPHPWAILGAGYNGIRHALTWLVEGDHPDFVLFDRYERVGGHAWLVQANKTSKLQTEFSAFHVWFGTPFDDTNPRLGYPTEWETWPKQDQVIAHMQHAAERYGILPHIKFKHEVKSMDIVGKPHDLSRYYVLTYEPVGGREEQELKYQCSAFMHFPGAYFNPRIIIYPGETEFDGEICFGMNNNIPYESLPGARCCILGNGAYAVENVRTCLEYCASKVYLVTRRKNLPCPRLCCWFCHQAQIPTPAAQLMWMFEPMFLDTGFGNPWDFHSVYASQDHKNCTIVSNSRFGIGDITFLAVATGRCEYVQDLTKRLSRNTVHTVNGTKMEGVTILIKCLGLIADFACDRLHKIKEMIGIWPAGDYRRYIYCDPLGMNAANFTTFSAGIGCYSQSVGAKYLLNYPQEYQRIIDTGGLDMLPRSKASEEKPAHQYGSKYGMSCDMVTGSVLNQRLYGAKFAGMDQYMHRMMWAANPFDKYFAECKNGWDQYQEDWWKQGVEFDYVPYPYTKEICRTWFQRFQDTVGDNFIAGEPLEHAYAKQVGPEFVERLEEAERRAGAAAQGDAGEDHPECNWEMPGSQDWWQKEFTGSVWRTDTA